MNIPHQDNPVMQLGWAGFLQWAIQENGIVERFEKETGMKMMPPPKNALEAMIDKSTGVNDQYVEAFAEWATRELWGLEQADQTNQAVKGTP